MRRRTIWIWLALGAAILSVLLVIFIRFYIDEPLRQTIEHNVNKRLEGYSVRISTLKFQPLGFSLDLVDSTIFQNAHPDPPVAFLPKLHASVHWQALLHGRLVADFLIDRPKLYINLKQAKQEVEDKVSMAERGWQDALAEIYPLKLNFFTVRDAEITYVDEGPFKPLHLSKVNFRAGNILNIHSRENVYPSDVHLDGVVFDSGKIRVDGQADFLAKPHMGIKGALSVKQMELDYFKPIISRYNFLVRNGVLSSDGRFEYAPSRKVANLEHVTIQDLQIGFVHKAETATVEKQLGQKVARTAKAVSNQPDILLRVDRVNVLKSRFTFANEASQPEYRIFIADADLSVNNLSNQGADGKAIGTLTGNFMGSGRTAINIVFQPKATSADFDLKVRIDEAKMTAMNDLLLAYGNFDVAEGLFSLYSELSVRNGAIDGYVKPLFKDIDVYDDAKDADKPFSLRLRQRMVGTLAWALSNRPRNEVATTIALSGKLDSPQYSSWEAFLGLVKNAFIKGLTPGFEEKAGPSNAPEKTVSEKSPARSSTLRLEPPALAGGCCSGFRPTGVLEGATGLPVGLHELRAIG